jgi:hypothetical protein
MNQEEDESQGKGWLRSIGDWFGECFDFLDVFDLAAAAFSVFRAVGHAILFVVRVLFHFIID